MTNQIPLIEQFANYLRFERHFSPYTARCYEADLRQYVEFFESAKSHGDVEPAKSLSITSEEVVG